MKNNYTCRFREGKLLSYSNKPSTLFYGFLFFFSFITYAQTPDQKELIIQQSNYSELITLQLNTYEKEILQKTEAFDAAQTNGWEVKESLEDGSFAELQKLGPNGEPIYYVTSNAAAAKSTRTNHLNSGGSLGLNLNGQNMTAHVWDGGHARVTHQEYDGAGGRNRVSVEDSRSENGVKVNFHAAHVTGTIAASGVQANAKGMAPQTKVKGFMWNNDTSEAITEASKGMIISNHSYGYKSSSIPDQWFGAYIDESRKWDQVMFNAPFYLMVVAAGNDGNNNSYNSQPLDGNSSYDKLTGHSTSKNNLVVANAQDANVANNGTLNSVTINSSSSEGPTDDYRIKPDITGNGTNVYSTYHRSDTHYASISGTSMASPNVTGTLLLLQQHFNNINDYLMKAATLKGIALHTADDIGRTGPDAIYGWGLLNAKVAAEVITNNGTSSKIEELVLNNNQTYSIKVTSDGSSPLLASISWTDRAGAAVRAVNSKNPVLVNDLDIRVTKGSSTYNPYRLTGVNTNSKGDNKVDPYERVEVANASGTYTITVTHKGSLVGSSQNFSLILTGITTNTGTCNATIPTDVSSSNIGTTKATIGWDDVRDANFDLRYRQINTSTWKTVHVNNTSRTITGLSASTTYEVQVRSKCPNDKISNYSDSVSFTTKSSNQLDYCVSKSGDTSDEHISRFRLGSIDNVSNAESGYSNYTSISTKISKNKSYSISINPTWSGTKFNEAYGVWIDFNQDGDFEDSGEQVLKHAKTQKTLINGSFVVPQTAVNGATRMRVILRYVTEPKPCGSFGFGEVEDYTVIIEPGSDTGDICEGVPAWTSRVYRVGEEIVYFGRLFRRASNAWIYLGECGKAAASRAPLVSKTVKQQFSKTTTNFSIYPNPVTRGSFNVQTNNTSEIKEYTIINTLGQIIQSGTFTETIDLKQTKPGIYILKTQNHTKQFIIQ